MSFENCAGKRVIYAGEYGVVKDFNEMFGSMKVRFDNKKTQCFIIDDYVVERDNNGVIHVVEKVVPGQESVPSENNVTMLNVMPSITDTNKRAASSVVRKIYYPISSAGLLSDGRTIPSRDYRVYHSTCLDNFLSMVRCGVFASRDWLGKNNIKFRDVSVLTPDREKFNIHKRIPFHFFPKNPFDYSVFGWTNNKVSSSNMVVITVDRRKFDDCSYVYPCLPTAKQWKLPNYEDSYREWQYFVMANGAKGFRPKRYNCSDSEWLDLPFWHIIDKYYKSDRETIVNNKIIRQILLAEYDIDREVISLDEILKVYVSNYNAYDKIKSEDTKGILNGKIVVGDLKYSL